MSKNSGMGRKRIDNKDSKGLGKCAPNSRAEQCGDGRGLSKGKLERMTKEKVINPFNSESSRTKPILPQTNDLILLKKQAKELEAELKKVKNKILNFNN